MRPERPEKLEGPHLAYFLEAQARLRAGQAAWEFFVAVVSRDLELPDGTQIEPDGTIRRPVAEEAVHDE